MEYEKGKAGSEPQLKAIPIKNEVHCHLHTTLVIVAGDGTTSAWDSAINVGTNDADDLLQYKLVFDFQHPVIEQLRKESDGFCYLTGKTALPALDFLRSDILSGTGPWQQSEHIQWDFSIIYFIIGYLNMARV